MSLYGLISLDIRVIFFFIDEQCIMFKEANHMFYMEIIQHVGCDMCILLNFCVLKIYGWWSSLLVSYILIMLYT